MRLRFLKEFVESAARIVGVARGWGAGVHRRGRGRRGLAGGAFAGHRYARREERAFVSFVLQRNAHRDGLETLETGGGLEVRALFTAVQIRIAFWAGAAEVRPGGNGRGAVITTGRRHVLHEAGKPRAGDIERRARARRFGPIFAKGLSLTVRVHVPVLSILAFAVHREELLRTRRDENECF